MSAHVILSHRINQPTYLLINEKGTTDVTKCTTNYINKLTYDISDTCIERSTSMLLTMKEVTLFGRWHHILLMSQERLMESR